MSLSNILERDYLDHFLSRVTKASQEPYHRTAEEGERRYIVPCRLINRRPRNYPSDNQVTKILGAKTCSSAGKFALRSCYEILLPFKGTNLTVLRRHLFFYSCSAAFRSLSFYRSLGAQKELRRFLLAWKMMLI